MNSKGQATAMATDTGGVHWNRNVRFKLRVNKIAMISTGPTTINWLARATQTN